MSLYELIKKDKIIAMKEKDLITKRVITIFQGDITTIAKREQVEISDDLCVKVLTKMKKDLNVLLDTGNVDLIETQKEIDCINKYLPKSLSNDEIVLILEQNKFESLKEAFSYFSKNHKNQYDSKVISIYFK